MEDKMSKTIRFDLVLKALGRAWLWLAAATVAGLLLGIILVHVLGLKYTATMVVIPASSDADRISGLGSVSSLLGGSMDLPLSRFKEFQVAISSTGVAALLDSRGAICKIFPSCDPAANSWAPRQGVRALISQTAHMILNTPATSSKPTVVQMADYIEKNVTVEVQKSGAVTMTYENKDPAVAIGFLNDLASATNDYIKDNDRESQREYVAYISNKLANLTVLSQRPSLETLLTDQTRRLMLTEVGVPYAANVLVPPTAAIDNPLVTIALSAVAGLLIAAGIVIAMAFLPTRSKHYAMSGRHVSSLAE